MSGLSKTLAMLVAVSGLGVTTGCVSAEQIAAQDDYTCNNAGAAAGTPEHAQCRMLLYQQRVANRQAAAARMYAMGAAMQNASASMAPAAVATPYATPGGFTKVCTYQSVTGPRAVTVGSTDLCPLTLP